MKLIRYRRPSINTIFGITRAKRSFRRATGISTLEQYTKPSRIKQHYKQNLAFIHLMRVVRQTLKGNFSTFLGLFKKNK